MPEFIEEGEVRNVDVIAAPGIFEREFILKKGARLNLNYRINDLAAWQEKCVIRLQGEGAEVKIRGIMHGQQQATLHYALILEHAADYTESHVEFRGVAEDRSQLIFDGLIKVPAHVKGIIAFEENRNLLLSNAAEIQSRPRLEIDSNEVACRHGATIGDLDENQLFYLMSRGIPETEARVLLVNAFLGFF